MVAELARDVDVRLRRAVARLQRVVCRDELACDTFELYALRRAGDLEPFERARREMLLGAGG